MPWMAAPVRFRDAQLPNAMKSGVACTCTVPNLFPAHTVPQTGDVRDVVPPVPGI